ARYGQIFMDGSGFNIKGWTSSGEPIIYNAAATGASHRFQVAGAEKVRITNDGLTFNGDTAAANALDDYEEGTFSPTLANASNITSLTLSEAGRYVKIGSLVHFECQVEGSITSASSEARFSLTLPFNTATTSPRAVGMFAFIRGGAYSDSRFSNGQVYQGTSANSFIYVYIGSTQIPANGSFEGRLTFTYQAA
ncbi:hypothetical protein OAA25_00635, partial [bacterium]|nr:hypothetical protein [bacterium]